MTETQRDEPAVEATALTFVDEDAQGRQLRQHLTSAARTWSTGGREDSESGTAPSASGTPAAANS